MPGYAEIAVQVTSSCGKLRSNLLSSVLNPLGLNKTACCLEASLQHVWNQAVLVSRPPDGIVIRTFTTNPGVTPEQCYFLFTESLDTLAYLANFIGKDYSSRTQTLGVLSTREPMENSWCHDWYGNTSSMICMTAKCDVKYL